MDDVDHFSMNVPYVFHMSEEELLDVQFWIFHGIVLSFPSDVLKIFAGAQAEARWRGVAVRLRQLSGGRVVWIFDTLDGQL